MANCKHWNWNWCWNWKCSRKYYIFLTIRPRTTKLGRVVTCDGGNSSTKSRDLLTTWSREKWKSLCLQLHITYDNQTWQSGNLHCATPSTKSCDLLITRSLDKWKTCTSATPIAIKLDIVVTWGGGPSPPRHVTFSSSSHLKNLTHQVTISWTTWPRDNRKNLYLHFRTIYGSKTWQSGELGWGDRNYQVIWIFDHVVTWSLFVKCFQNICCYSLDIIEFIECSVTMSRLENYFDTILFSFSELKIRDPNNAQICLFRLVGRNQTFFFQGHIISLYKTLLTYY